MRWRRLRWAWRRAFRWRTRASALAEMQPGDKRGEMLEIRGATLINDCYNSNPEALKSMIRDACRDAGRAPHPGCGRDAGAGAGRAGAASLLRQGSGGWQASTWWSACGEMRSRLLMARRQAGVEAIFVETPEEAGEWLRSELKAGDAVLLKASRGVRLEQALDRAARGSEVGRK